MPDRRLFLKEALVLSGALLSLKGKALSTRERSSVIQSGSLPGEYFRRLSKDSALVGSRLQSNPGISLQELEAEPGWSHFPYAILAAAVLYARKHPTNSHYKDPSMLALALQIGDLLVREDEQNKFSPRPDSYRDVYMWVEAYRLLEPELGAQRSRKWSACLVRNISLLESEATTLKDAPAYIVSFLDTSPNHLAWKSVTLLMGGKYLNHRPWVDLGSFILGRLVATEQNPDGYWGEHNPDGPTIGYNYVTTMAVGVYWEHSHDPRALRALQRATEFFSYFTYPNGTVVELLNDRNRYWEPSADAHFAFSHFADGRGYAAMLLSHIPDQEVHCGTMGPLAQNALYYHEGPVEKIPPQRSRYFHRLKNQAGIRKNGAWVTAFCGIIDTPRPSGQFFLDRQANVSLFHERAGLIISGANSKSQPELATFSEKYGGVTHIQPFGSRLTMTDSVDCLAVAFQTFSCEILAPIQTEEEAHLQFRITGRGPKPEEAYLTLQLCLNPGGILETGTGHRVNLTGEKIELTPAVLGRSITHQAWTLTIDTDATLIWPVFPYNPYRNARETKLKYAVAVLRVPLHLRTDPAHYIRLNEQNIHVRVRVPKRSLNAI